MIIALIVDIEEIPALCDDCHIQRLDEEDGWYCGITGSDTTAYHKNDDCPLRKI